MPFGGRGTHWASPGRRESRSPKGQTKDEQLSHLSRARDRAERRLFSAIFPRRNQEDAAPRGTDDTAPQMVGPQPAVDPSAPHDTSARICGTEHSTDGSSQVSRSPIAGLVSSSPQHHPRLSTAPPSATGRGPKNASDAEWERALFKGFAASAPLPIDPGSVKSGETTEGEPDIFCRIDGQPHCFELCVIASVPLTEERHPCVGRFDQVHYLTRGIESKAEQPYSTYGAPLDLLLYYDEHYLSEAQVIDAQLSGLAEFCRRRRLPNRWYRVWVYSKWQRRLLWSSAAGYASSRPLRHSQT